MTNALAREIWEGRGIRGKSLRSIGLPLSVLYGIAIRLRNILFDLGWLKATQLSLPVISVGNLTVGGTGKTPTSLWLAQELRQRGFKVGILSRGYRRKHSKAAVVSQSGNGRTDEDIGKFGDEPLMMARLYGQHVGVSKNRSDAATELLRVAQADVFILDDGFQHRWVKRDVDLLLLGAETSGRMLPAGPFREPRKNLRRADFLLATAAQSTWKDLVPAKRAEGFYTGSLRPVCLVGFNSQSFKEYPLTLLYRSKILTVTGVADPQGLYRLIHDWDGEIVQTLEFPDHHLYTTGDWQEINRMGRTVDLIITTEKDILKLQRFPFARDKLLACRVAMTVDNGEALIQAIVERLKLGDRV
jgi:tetraacyldisaccharide 4'-kinase